MALRVTNNNDTEIDGGGKRAAPYPKRASNGRTKWGGGGSGDFLVSPLICD